MPPTITPKPLIQGVLLDDSAPGSPGLYQAVDPSVVHSMTACNTDSSTRTATIYVVKSGDSEAAKSTIVKEIELAAKATVPIVPGLIGMICLAAGDYISAIADVAGVVSLRADGMTATT